MDQGQVYVVSVASRALCTVVANNNNNGIVAGFPCVKQAACAVGCKMYNCRVGQGSVSQRGEFRSLVHGWCRRGRRGGVRVKQRNATHF